MMRRIGQAKAGLAADYAAQLARNVGKVVFFAKHIDVMDAAEEIFARRGIRYSSIRGDQTPQVRQQNIDAFTKDPDVAVVGLLADRRRRRPQPPGRLQRRARRAVLDRRRADPGDRPGAPHRPGPAGHRLADHRRADDRRPDRRADRQQGRPGRPRPRRLRRGGRPPRSTSSSRRSSPCSPTRWKRPPPGRSPAGQAFFGVVRRHRLPGSRTRGPAPDVGVDPRAAEGRVRRPLVASVRAADRDVGCRAAASGCHAGRGAELPRVGPPVRRRHQGSVGIDFRGAARGGRPGCRCRPERRDVRDGRHRLPGSLRGGRARMSVSTRARRPRPASTARAGAVRAQGVTAAGTPPRPAAERPRAPRPAPPG